MAMLLMQRGLMLQGPHIWKNGNRPCPLNGMRQGPLVFGTGTRNPSGDDLAAFGNKITQQLLIFIIDDDTRVGAKTAHFPAVINSSFFLWIAAAAATFLGIVCCHLSTPLPCFQLVWLSLRQSRNLMLQVCRLRLQALLRRSLQLLLLLPLLRQQRKRQRRQLPLLP